ncbi:hypothetical protein H9L05_09805 [Hymenobacter qilianensis]|uniref:PEP-CTERM sorting domain-containing protein n=1 Tax=Hymenobacter qilianensis TaxID=1385715 RepID=A0A7H0GZT0_9BACT|nr:hypothetical protein [Hymenobacter qilianensis]QNP53796.1 hypothetical protein H9L05_09805 [Hymenobacter qilianensis]
MRAFILGLIPLVFSIAANAQLVESFADGNLNQNPTWAGDEGSFQVSGEQLQSNGPATTGTTLQLVTASTAASGVTWEFYANLRLATSGAIWPMSGSWPIRPA